MDFSIFGEILSQTPPCLTITFALLLTGLIFALYTNYGGQNEKSEPNTDFDVTKALEFIRERRSIFPKDYSD